MLVKRSQKPCYSCRRWVQGAVVLVLLAIRFILPPASRESNIPELLTTTNSGTTLKSNIQAIVASRNNEITSTQVLPGRPPLSSLIAATDYDLIQNRAKMEISGNVQFLLDYAIVGFSKCGTTTLLKWIMRDPNVRTFKREIHEIVQQNPGRLVERLYHNLLEDSEINTTISAQSKVMQGFKNPEILQSPSALQYLDSHWPETKLIVSVRNPLKWFRSFYNFRLTLGHLDQVGRDPNALIGACGPEKILCTHMGAFHVKLFRLGKTAMTSQEELGLLKPFVSLDDDADIWNQIHETSPTTTQTRRMKNKIFFLDLRQLADSNRTRASRFRHDLQEFLGLEHDLTRVFRARPFKQLELTIDEESKRHTIDNICDVRYAPLQQNLVEMAQTASTWIRNYFLKSPDVVVSSPEYLESLLETWMVNPCSIQQDGV